MKPLDTPKLIWRTRLERIRMELPEGFQAVLDQAVKEIEAQLSETAPNVEDAGMPTGDPHPCDMTPEEREKFFAPSAIGECICPKCGIRHGGGPTDGTF